MWIHQKCEGLSKVELNNLSKTPLNELNFICKVCVETQHRLPFHNESTLPEEDDSFEFPEEQEEQVNNITLDDHSAYFRGKGLHFGHLNCNSLISKIEEIREFILQTKPHVMCFSETKLDPTIIDEEIAIGRI